MVEIEYLTSDSNELLVAKGDFTREQLIKMAYEQNVIDQGDFDCAEYYQSHFKVSPAPRDSGYSTWHYPRETPCKGSYFASVLQK